MATRTDDLTEETKGRETDSLSFRTPAGALRALVVYGYLGYAPYYLYWRLGTFNAGAPVFSWLLWVAELFGVFTAVLHVFMVRRLTHRVPPAPPQGGTVDVFVTTYNESVAMLARTLSAAMRMAYPHQTWLLDDGHRPEMAALAQRLGCRYLARSDNRDAKAGNLNHALAQSSADFVAVFDADHVPRSDFLVRTLGFFRDERVAFVQTPQDFYNLDSYQHRRHRRLSFIWTEQSLFFRVIQRGKDFWNAAFFCGSCAVLRRSALTRIGGFATGTVTEDLHTSIRLHKAGYRSVYLNESLAYGLAPESVGAFLSQRLRWGQGGIQVWRKEGILFARGLTVAQRLNYLASVLTYFDGWQKAVFYLSPIVVLLTGVMPISHVGGEFLAHFVPFYVLCFWAYEEAGRGYGRTLLTEQYNMARFFVFVRASLSGFFRRARFSVTPKGIAQDADARRVLPQLFIVAASAAAIVLGVGLWFTLEHLPPLALAANVFWAGLNLGLAGAVVRFSIRKRQRRRDYRFPIPLPVQIEAAGERVLALATDVSAKGCQIISETELTPGVPVKGRLFLPGVQIDFEAEPRSRGQAPEILRAYEAAPAEGRRSRRKHHYGLVFEPLADPDMLALEQFLYGSDLQWRVSGLSEQVSTPIARLLELLNGDASRRRLGRLSPREWLPVVLVSPESGHEALAVLSRTDWRRDPARLLSFGSVSPGAEFRLHVFGYHAGAPIEAIVQEVEALDTISGPVHLAVVTLRKAESGTGFPG